MNDVEKKIGLRIGELEKSIGGILPPPSVRIRQIVDDAKEERVKYITERISEAAATNPLYDNPPKAKKRNLMVWILLLAKGIVYEFVVIVTEYLQCYEIE